MDIKRLFALFSNICIKNIAFSCILLILFSCESDILNLDGIGTIGADLIYDDSQSNIHLKTAVVAMTCSIEKDDNIQSIKRYIQEIVDSIRDIELIVFGETILGYYYNESDPNGYQNVIGEEIPGPTTEMIAEMTRNYTINVIIGMAEKKGDKLYNSLVFIDSTGSIKTISQKETLINKDISSGYSPGVSGKTIIIKGIKLGLIICSDNTSQTLVDRLIDSDVDIVIHSAAGGGEDIQRIYARIVNAWVVQANRVGKEGNIIYNGFIGICDPTGYYKVSSKEKDGWIKYNIGIYK